jgi:hypothetical protein
MAFSRVLEKLIFERIMKHLHTHNILTSHQFGFRANRTTEQAIFSLVNSVLESLNNKQLVGRVFCNLQKAFDAVNHNILLKKLEYYGIQGSIKKLIQSYLMNRQQMVILNGNFSTWKTIQCGVPQGSVLGPLLFLIYINDLPSCLEKSNSTTILYADDKSIILTESNLTAFNSHFNVTFSQINAWFNKNLLHLNLNKTQFIEFKSKSTLLTADSITSCNNNLSNVKSTKFWGLIIDDTLNWHLNVESLLKRLSKAIYVLRYLKYFLYVETLKMIYFAQFHSLIRYGIIFWGNSAGGLKYFTYKKRYYELYAI